MHHLKSAFFALLLVACSAPARVRPGHNEPDAGSALPDLGPARDLGPAPFDPDAGPREFDPSAACAVATETAKVEYQPVDIIWVVDNSPSMKLAVDTVTTGINDFANVISGMMHDYRIIMLSLRSEKNPVTIGSNDYYAVCVPPPLAAPACGNSTRFFHSNVNIRSVQPLEQLLGTLGQTDGYKLGESRGGEPWKQQLRPGAAKTIVLISDDNSRLTAKQFQTFAGGTNPYSTATLPPGILDASWGGLFDGFTFSAIYGWGSDTNPSVACTYPNGMMPPSAGPTYTELVQQTKGVRARICDDATTWKTFFQTVAQAVVHGSKLTCDLGLPTPSQGTLDPGLVNVTIDGPAGQITLKKVGGAGGCTAGGWYYDDDANPQHVILCPSSCDVAQQQVTAPGGGAIHVHFGCQTIIS
jgi:hypothetical protein